MPQPTHHLGDTNQAMNALIAALGSREQILGWAEQTYEPETHAFGGADAMTVAHALFHTDSRHILRHQALVNGPPTTAASLVEQTRPPLRDGRPRETCSVSRDTTRPCR
ncbi:thiopeptide-type bacteriocin biosynthesis protein [Micromonospora sp. URMC 106]|uniref:thiopeptide-type bacteriocin biosynthesis protein n=1 Tax=Micromonospora sp. URMC 106 TaxID=3423408 RepID=UPI003F1B5EE4